MTLQTVRCRYPAGRRVTCQNNFRKFFNGFDAYAELHEGRFPRVDAEGPHAVAGVFVPALNDAGLINDVSVDCPATGHREAPAVTLGQLARLHATDDKGFYAAARRLTRW